MARTVCISLALVGLIAVSAQAAPPEPPTKGLVLWLDADTIHQVNRTAVATWPDARGSGLVPHQGDTTAQPMLRSDVVPGHRVVRFDGRNDFLELPEFRQRFGAMTVVVVASARSNAGIYRALIEANEPGRNDYVTGFNIDLGGGGGSELERINIEGVGFGGERNMLSAAHPFGTFHALTVTSSPETGTALYRNGKLEGTRPRTSGTINAEQLRLGCRYYSNTAEPAAPHSFFDGDLAEVLIYDRVLSDADRASLDKYLNYRHEALLKVPGLPPEPLLRMLVPGFEVRELPVSLTNVNDLVYRPDGKLLALGYNGQIWLLSDTDGDGLEDHVEPYWDKPTLRQPIAMLLRPEGLYVSSHGKISLLRDTDGDDHADTEEIVAEGWPQPDVSTNGVDAVGMAFAPDGDLYFAVGCSDFTNAFRVKDGKSHYNLKDERGTILRLNVATKKREIVCTGVRFPYALAFNPAGDLFFTDQEGATWLPNGNPLDELNHFQPGRHYGFPYRHEKYLPSVVDAPPVAAYGPQHQSTCGLTFNNPAKDGNAFGPPSWEGDALVAGFSRGRLFRTRLVKSPEGYVSYTWPIAVGRMLLLDTAVSPSGDLAVTCHSGPPDWGTGPEGPGKLLKIVYKDRRAAQPIMAWPESPTRVRVALDREVSDAQLAEWSKAEIEYGDAARPGDRFERLKPPYQAVQDQGQLFRGRLRVIGVRKGPQNTLVVETDPHPVQTNYVLALAGLEADDRAACDVMYSFSGVAADWAASDDKQPKWTGWLPHLDPEVSLKLLTGSAVGATLREKLEMPGTLTLRTNSSLPPSTFHLVSYDGGRKIAPPPPKPGELDPSDDGNAKTTLNRSIKTPFKPGEALTALGRNGLDVVRVDELQLPWAPVRLPPPPAPTGPAPELAGGDWNRGKALFFSDESNCSACHRVRGEGKAIGPDLTNLAFRDPRSVLRDIREPSAALNPDYVPFVLTLKDGRALTGLVRTDPDQKLRVTDAQAHETIVAAADVDEMQASRVSIMPQGMAEKLGPAKLRDLLTFLLLEPPAEVAGAPPPRSRKLIDEILGPADKSPPKADPLTIVLAYGTKDHGPGEHDYPHWQKQWNELLPKLPGVKVRTAFEWPSADDWKAANVVAFYHMHQKYTPERLAEMDKYLARGGGIMVLHSAVAPEKESEPLAARFGLAWHWGTSKFRHGPLDLHIAKDDTSGIVARVPNLHFVDETYWPLVGDPGRIHVLATAKEDDAERPMLWTYQPGQGRVFCCVLGHYTWTFDDPIFRILVLRGMAWSAHEPLDRFRPMMTDGVKFAD